MALLTIRSAILFRANRKWSLLETPFNIAIHIADTIADQCHDTYHDDGNKDQDQTVLDQTLPGLVGEKTANHYNPPFATK